MHTNQYFKIGNHSIKLNIRKKKIIQALLMNEKIWNGLSMHRNNFKNIFTAPAQVPSRKEKGDKIGIKFNDPALETILEHIFDNNIRGLCLYWGNTSFLNEMTKLDPIMNL